MDDVKSALSQLMTAYDLLPFPVLLIDENAIIKASNEAATDSKTFVTNEIIGFYVGDVFGCVNALNGTCGNTPMCSSCPIRQTINKSLSKQIPINSYLCNYRVPVDSSIDSKHAYVVDTLEKHVYISTSPVVIENKAYIIFTAGDVTDSKKMEDTLRTSLKLNSMVDTLSVDELLIYCLDEAERLLDSSISYFHLYNSHQKTVHLKAWSTNSIRHCKTKSLKDVIYDVSQDMIWEETLSTRMPFLMNHVPPNQKHLGYPCNLCSPIRLIVVPIFDGKQPVAFMSVANSTTSYDQYDIDVLNVLAKNIWIYMERKLLQTKTIESNTRYDELASRIPIGVYRYETLPNQTIIWKYMSPRFLTLLGIDANISTHHPNFIQEMVHPDDLSSYMTTYRLSTKGPQPFIWEGRILTKKHVIDVHIEAIPTVKSASSIIWDGIVYDISNQKELEEALRESKYRAEIAAQAKSSFLANMSHEIRTPMNAIIGFNDLLRKTPLTEKQQSYLNRSDMAAKNLLSIINDILDYSKIEAGKMNIESISFKLHEILNHVSNLLGLKASNKALEFVIDVNNDVPDTLIGDPLRLTQIIINLISNAIKFTNDGQVILKIEALSRSDSEVILSITVKDTGVGMSAREMEHLFMAFSQGDETTTRKFGGTGLGLSITKNLVELMGGSISVKSDKGLGSQFNIICSFTIDQNDADSDEILDSVFNLKAMVIDDHQVTREVIGTYLEKFNIEAILVHAGESALAMIDESFDIVILDYKLDGMNGLETWQHIKDKLAKTPKGILLTSFNRSDITDDAIKLGIDHIITKPVTPSILHDIISDIIGLDEYMENNDDDVSIIEGMSILNQKTVLLVEDNNINQQVATELLQQVGMIVDVANNGLEAVEMTRAKTYDLILMDLQMPVMDGYTAAVKIKIYDHYDAPIIALTADVMPDTKFKAKDSGMCAYISKPFNSKELYKTLIGILA